MAISLTELEVARFFLATILLLFSAYSIGYLFKYFRLPKAIGEITGGLFLGPTLLGIIAPTIYTKVFVQSSQLLDLLYWFGLIFLMFCSGFEIKTAFAPKDKKTVFYIVVFSTIVPLICGWFYTDWITTTSLIGPANNLLSLKLLIMVAFAVTSIPVISKIFFDLGIIQSNFAKIVLGVATIHDLILWVFLAVATGLVSSSALSVNSIAIHVALTVLFFALAFALSPLLISTARKVKLQNYLESYETGFLLLILLFFVVIASYLHINLVFGALLAGVVISNVKRESFVKVRENIKEFSFAFFIPLYFALVGFKLDLLHHFDIVFFISFFIVALLVQGVAVTIAARLLRYSWLSTFNLAIALNARGGPGIVAATVGYQAGIISETFFVTLVMLSILSSLLAGVWLQFVCTKKWNLLDN